jgi:hypothetical protein
MGYPFHKNNENDVGKEVIEKYSAVCGWRGILISSISDEQVNFSTLLISCKFLRKCQKEH